jgi:hypothetical protein
MVSGAGGRKRSAARARSPDVDAPGPWPKSDEQGGIHVAVRQVSVFLQNKAGRLAEVISALAGQGLAIRGFSLADTSDYGIVRVLTDRGEEAARTLRERGFTTVENDVACVDVGRDAERLAELLALLSDACVNVEYLYLTSVGGVAMKVDDPADVERLASGAGFRLSQA